MAPRIANLAFEIALLFRWLAYQLRWITHPIAVFVFLVLSIAAIIVFWVLFYVDEHSMVTQLATDFGAQHLDDGYALVLLILGCILLGMVLVGTIALFVFGLRQRHFALQQKTFVSSVTHELRSPLASLQLTFDTMRTRQLDDETHGRMMEMIYQDLFRLRRLVDQILVSSRLDRGLKMAQNDDEPLHLADIIDQVCESYHNLYPNLQDRLDINCPNDLVIVSSKPALSLILSNLLENAVKYSPGDSPIRIIASRDGDLVNLQVVDEGTGLGKREVRKIFKMFHRGQTATRKAVPGTGIGLYIVSTVVRVLGGRVWAESPGRGKGSTFHVTLPATGARP